MTKKKITAQELEKNFDEIISDIENNQTIYIIDDKAVLVEYDLYNEVKCKCDNGGHV